MIPQVLATSSLAAADRWTTLPERGTPASLRLIAWIAVHIGRAAARLLLYPITLYFVITARAAAGDILRILEARARPFSRTGGMSSAIFIVSPRRFWIAFICCAASSSAFDVTVHEKELLQRADRKLAKAASC